MAFNNATKSDTNDSSSGDDEELNLIKVLLANCIGDGSQSVKEKLWTALVNSCYTGRDDILELILTEENANIKWCHNVDGLHKAFIQACGKGFERIVRLLTKHYYHEAEDQNAPSLEKWRGCAKAGLRTACVENFDRIVEFLLVEYKLGWDSEDTIMDEVFIYLCDIGYYEIVELLVKFGYDVNTCDGIGTTALVHSCIQGCKNVAELLIRHGADVNKRNTFSQSPLTAACMNGHTGIVELLLSHKADVNAPSPSGKRPLFFAIQDGYNDVVDVLLMHRADFKARDEHGNTPLLCACEKGRSLIVEELITRGIDVNVQSKQAGITPIMMATFKDHVTCLKLLLAADANLDLVDIRGGTVMTYAMEWSGDCLRALLEDGRVFEDSGGGKLKLKSVHEKAIECADCMSREALIVTIEHGLFQWGWCPPEHCEEVSLAAMNAGFCPGKIKFQETKVSPLVLSFIRNDIQTVEMFQSRTYYFPEDCEVLSRDEAVRDLIRNKPLLDSFVLQPLSLATWSFLTVSKCISLSGLPKWRRTRVDLLPLPSAMKKRLKFEK